MLNKDNIVIFATMKKILFIISLISLSSCTKVYKEIWTVERVPIQWEEEIIIPGDHMHYMDSCQEWKCLYRETDTFCWQHYDTLVVKQFDKMIRLK